MSRRARMVISPSGWPAPIASDQARVPIRFAVPTRKSRREGIWTPPVWRSAARRSFARRLALLLAFGRAAGLGPGTLQRVEVKAEECGPDGKRDPFPHDPCPRWRSGRAKTARDGILTTTGRSLDGHLRSFTERTPFASLRTDPAVGRPPHEAAPMTLWTNRSLSMAGMGRMNGYASAIPIPR